MKEKIRNIVNKYKFHALYATAFTAMSGVVEKAFNGGTLETSIDTMIENIPFFVGVNFVYGGAVNYFTKKAGKLGANLVCLGTNVAFLAYGSAVNGGVPKYEELAGSVALGLILTNWQAYTIQKKEKQTLETQPYIATTQDLLPDNAAFTNP